MNNLHVRAEIDRLWEMAQSGHPNRDQYYAAQQALSWALAPETFIAPMVYIRGIPAGPIDCPDALRLDRSQGTDAPMLDAA
jgi:hypothetical protein